MHEDFDALLPATLAAQRVGVSRQLLHYWCRTGRLKPSGTATGGQPRFRLGDVLAAEAAARSVPRGRRSRIVDSHRGDLLAAEADTRMSANSRRTVAA